MTIRLVGALLCGAALILATQTDLAQAAATTVKSSKSNTNDRLDGKGGKDAPPVKKKKARKKDA
jgi:hypothetical protein